MLLYADCDNAEIRPFYWPEKQIDDLIDIIEEKSRRYIPVIYALNKIDSITIEELDLLYSKQDMLAPVTTILIPYRNSELGPDIFWKGMECMYPTAIIHKELD